MNYTNDAKFVKEECACAAPVMPDPTMADIVKEVSFMAEQNHMLARRIQSFLMGVCEDDNERTQEPRCFREELMKVKGETRFLNEILGQLAVELGMP